MVFALSHRAALAAVFIAAAPWAAANTEAGEVTYARHIAPILQKNCQTCHHPGGIGPFSFTTYRQAKGWASMIKEVVVDKRMPPWHADPNHGEFRNDRRLSDADIAAIVKWADSGAPRGNPAEEPAPIDYNLDGWRIGGGEPDMIFTMPKPETIPPTGVMPYVNIEVPTNFKEDKWIQEMEAKAGNAKVVHHILIYARSPEEQQSGLGDFLRLGKGFLAGFAPGTVANVEPKGLAYKIPAGATIIFQMHYTPTGKEEVDQSSFGIVFADEPPTHEVLTATTVNFDFKIPAGDPNYRVEAGSKLPKDAVLYTMTPHMHYRGKSFDYIAKYPDGAEKILLRVPNYDFNWQTSYALAEPVYLPKGTTLHTVAHFDNSADNPFNPDPTKPVVWGDQTWEEMMIGWMTLSWVEGEQDLPVILDAIKNAQPLQTAAAE